MLARSALFIGGDEKSLAELDTVNDVTQKPDDKTMSRAISAWDWRFW